MSVVDVLARIQEIQAAVAPPAQSGSGTDGTAFASALAGASGQSQNALATVLAGTGATTATAQTTPMYGLSGATTTGAATASPATPAASGIPADVAPMIRQAAQEAGVDPSLVAAVARAESNFTATAVSPAGAQGMMQLMPGTARGLGVTDPFDAMQSLRGGARYLRSQLDRFGGDATLAVAAYNAGPGAVARAGGVPPYAETQAYVGKVLGYQREYAASGV